jgi:hypothetical protein
MTLTTSIRIAGAFLIASAAFGGDVPVCTHGNLELGLFGGESYGLDRFRPMVGGNIAYGLSCAFFPFAEASYLPGILRTNSAATVGSPSYRQFSIDMTDVHAGLHLRLPKPESRVLPYVVVGAGMIRQSAGTAVFFNVGFPGQPVDRQTVSVPSAFSPAFNFGGGLRFYFNDRFAVRIEMKGFKPTSAPAPLQPNLFYRFAIGPEFQLR